eukprot:scaffold727_cov173-Ochromonas_danica.AAC.13
MAELVAGEEREVLFGRRGQFSTKTGASSLPLAAVEGACSQRDQSEVSSAAHALSVSAQAVETSSAGHTASVSPNTLSSRPAVSDLHRVESVQAVVWPKSEISGSSQTAESVSTPSQPQIQFAA